MKNHNHKNVSETIQIWKSMKMSTKNNVLSKFIYAKRNVLQNKSYMQNDM